MSDVEGIFRVWISFYNLNLRFAQVNFGLLRKPQYLSLFIIKFWFV